MVLGPASKDLKNMVNRNKMEITKLQSLCRVWKSLVRVTCSECNRTLSRFWNKSKMLAVFSMSVLDCCFPFSSLSLKEGKSKETIASALSSGWKWRPRTLMCLSWHVLLPLDLKDKESWASVEDTDGYVERNSLKCGIESLCKGEWCWSREFNGAV